MSFSPNTPSTPSSPRQPMGSPAGGAVSSSDRSNGASLPATGPYPSTVAKSMRADVVPLSAGVGEEAMRVLYASVLRLWDVVDDLSRLRPERSAAYSVSVFGSARTVPGSKEYEDIKRLAATLTRQGCTVVTGGGPGLMQAANEGAREGAPDHPERSVGMRIALEFEQSVNPYVGEFFEHRTFFSRLHHFVLRSNAFVVTPGGIGTALELMTVWQLLQVRKLTQTPLVLVGEMWKQFVDWASRYMGPSQDAVDAMVYATKQELSIPQCVSTVDEALEIIDADHQRWSSSPVFRGIEDEAPLGAC